MTSRLDHLFLLFFVSHPVIHASSHAIYNEAFPVFRPDTAGGDYKAHSLPFVGTSQGEGREREGQRRQKMGNERKSTEDRVDRIGNG